MLNIRKFWCGSKMSLYSQLCALLTGDSGLAGIYVNSTPSWWIISGKREQETGLLCIEHLIIFIQMFIIHTDYN